MNFDKNSIIDKAIKVMEDLGATYLTEFPIKAVFFDEPEEEFHPAKGWRVFFRRPGARVESKEEKIILKISDDSGEPEAISFYRGKNGRMEIRQEENGKYITHKEEGKDIEI